MPRPRRNTAEAFYDVFADMPLNEQAIALRICEELHRQAQKVSKRKPEPKPEPEAQGSLLDQPKEDKVPF